LLSKESILQYSDFDEEFLLTTDTGEEIDTVLSPDELNNDLPVAYALRTLNKMEQNYNNNDKKNYCLV